MKTIAVGKKFFASAMALGCMRIADKSVKEVAGLIGTAIDNGIDYFDHADIYGGGKSEEVFGQALRENPSWRKSVKIQTKCGIARGKRCSLYDFSKEHILSAVEGSLRRLGLERVDALLLHRPDTLMEPEEVASAFDKLYESGKVKYFGVSNFNPMQTELLKKYVRQPLVANQLQLSAAFTGMIDCGLNNNMTNDASVRRDGSVLEYCRLNDITIQAWSPFCYGFFDGIFIGSPKYPELNETLARIGSDHGISPSATAVAWLLRHPARIQPIVGTTHPERLEDLCAAGDVTLTREEWYEIYLSAGNKLP